MSVSTRYVRIDCWFPISQACRYIMCACRLPTPVDGESILCWDVTINTINTTNCPLPKVHTYQESDSMHWLTNIAQSQFCSENKFPSCYLFLKFGHGFRSFLTLSQLHVSDHLFKYSQS